MAFNSGERREKTARTSWRPFPRWSNEALRLARRANARQQLLRFARRWIAGHRIIQVALGVIEQTFIGEKYAKRKRRTRQALPQRGDPIGRGAIQHLKAGLWRRRSRSNDVARGRSCPN